MPPAIISPTPAAPHFPVDPVALVRSEWPCLLVYYGVVIPVVFAVWRALRASRFINTAKQRVAVAAIMALIFTPSEVSDFFFFTIPGPAAIGLLFLTIGLAFAILSDPLQLLRAGAFGSLFNLMLCYYIIPFLFVFSLAYVGMLFYILACPATRRNA